MDVVIQIADADEPRLRAMATRCGYDTVEQLVSAYVAELTRRDAGEGLAPLSEEAMQASLAMIDQGMKDIDAGRYFTLEEARKHSLEVLREKSQ